MLLIKRGFYCSTGVLAAMRALAMACALTRRVGAHIDPTLTLPGRTGMAG